MHGQQAVEQPDEGVLLRRGQVAVDDVHVRVRRGGVEHGAVRGGIDVRAQRLDDERRAVVGPNARANASIAPSGFLRAATLP